MRPSHASYPRSVVCDCVCVANMCVYVCVRVCVCAYLLRQIRRHWAIAAFDEHFDRATLGEFETVCVYVYVCFCMCVCGHMCVYVCMYVCVMFSPVCE